MADSSDQTEPSEGRFRFTVNTIIYVLTLCYIFTRIRKTELQIAQKMYLTAYYFLLMTVLELIRYTDAIIVAGGNQYMRFAVNWSVVGAMLYSLRRVFKELGYDGRRRFSWRLFFVVKAAIFLFIFELFRYSDVFLSYYVFYQDRSAGAGGGDGGQAVSTEKYPDHVCH